MRNDLIVLYLTIFLVGVLSTLAFGARKSEYILRAGDVIEIKVVDHDEFSQKTRIRPDGMINYPVIGEVEVGGLTTEQLVKIMEEKLAPYVNNVVVSITIDQYFSNKIFILGDVARSGEVQIYEPIDVLKALAASGGLRNPKTKNIKIIRSNGDITNIDLRVMLDKKGATTEETYLLYPGDTMFVPENPTIPWGFISMIIGLVSSTIGLTLLIINLST
ncbi:MAG: hypothetical protein A2268_09605 [Candidatus Raymondbacteria bacterium RifOxyA12_full_50_37]|uniref:Soluble ligand binding domain-containing protein n=1 Tax=Candidatus Raymondbacteria bacterium RIFOXYD12_FULL_49_13 TaxID=1817890 RepID=A0A1F7F1C5_UNCRA|nr:MAG: hypothetical protein A2268_09605 [Candidatus Raymondbacteria bacterium RifOxyA12_full_50_37]OGJ93143.1 MAG: hypothetical protein A2350_17800 [Candidatus Raymondbacteria bacterium RifOxyB12_full_50_8]OGJ93905.1 MAG: hypothetical protein A2248_06690 [Candidatus Raymondbacteria bacterium RIFOXYA2_FULL_49_16]OGJ98226.1 MAG: hypothetical protein A2453_00475 [Candidatus Raymondbacteria bacterium RIFOXYC2_FULL_50_21]OGK00459.1 MAG: hypothetical protein A2519_10650 [Candidatus Raymondbacteria b